MQLPEVPSTQQKKKRTVLLIIVPRRSLLILFLEPVAGRKATNAAVCSNDDAVWGVTAADHRFWAEHTADVSAVKAVIGAYPSRSLILRMPAIVKKPLRESEWSLPFLLESRAKDKAIAAVRAKKKEDGAVESAAAAEKDEPVDTYVAIFPFESTEITE
jgi:hypothetical protein